MSIADAVIEKITIALAGWVPDKEPGRSDDDEQWRANRQPDVLATIPIADAELSPSDDRPLLGSYRPMSSPGMITLYSDNLSKYSRCVLTWCYRAAQFPTDMVTVKQVVSLIVFSTYEHERFHYICDFWRQLASPPVNYDPLFEEALATAREWHWIADQRITPGSFVYGMEQSLLIPLRDRLFANLSAGYRDYIEYTDRDKFEREVTQYLRGTPAPRSRAPFDRQNGFNFGKWVVAHTADALDRAWKETGVVTLQAPTAVSKRQGWLGYVAIPVLTTISAAKEFKTLLEAEEEYSRSKNDSDTLVDHDDFSLSMELFQTISKSYVVYAWRSAANSKSESLTFLFASSCSELKAELKDRAEHGEMPGLDGRDVEEHVKFLDCRADS